MNKPPDTLRLVEDSLLKKALGYDYEETRTEFSDKTGEKTVTTSHHVSPDVRALTFWLKNRCPNRWQDKPQEPEDTEGVTILDDL